MGIYLQKGYISRKASILLGITKVIYELPNLYKMSKSTKSTEALSNIVKTCLNETESI